MSDRFPDLKKSGSMVFTKTEKVRLISLDPTTRLEVCFETFEVIFFSLILCIIIKFTYFFKI